MDAHDVGGDGVDPNEVSEDGVDADGMNEMNERSEIEAGNQMNETKEPKEPNPPSRCKHLKPRRQHISPPQNKPRIENAATARNERGHHYCGLALITG